MAFTGDIKNNVEALRRELRKLKCTKEVDFQTLVTGTHWGFVALYRFLFCDYSSSMTSVFLEHGFEMTGTSDYKFMETAYKILRDLFQYKPPLTVSQFFSAGFPGRKLFMAAEICSKLGQFNSTVSRPSVQKSVLSQAILATNNRKKKSQLDDGIEIVDYTRGSSPEKLAQQDARPSSRSSSSKKSGRGVGGAAKSGKSGNVGSARKQQQQTAPQSNGGRPLGQSWEEPVSRSTGPARTTANLRGYSSGDEAGGDVGGRRRRREEGDMNLLSELLQPTRDLVRAPPPPPPHPAMGAPFAAQRRPAAPEDQGVPAVRRTAEVASPPTKPDSRFALKSSTLSSSDTEWAPDKTLASTVNRISRELENIMARLTLIETRMEKVEHKLEFRSSVGPISPPRAATGISTGLGGGSLSASPYKPAPMSAMVGSGHREAGLVQGMPSEFGRPPLATTAIINYKGLLGSAQDSTTPLSQARELFRDSSSNGTYQPRANVGTERDAAECGRSRLGGGVGGAGSEPYDLVLTNKYRGPLENAPRSSGGGGLNRTEHTMGSGRELFGSRDTNSRADPAGGDAEPRGDLMTTDKYRPERFAVSSSSDMLVRGDNERPGSRLHEERKSYAWLRPSLDADMGAGPRGDEKRATTDAADGLPPPHRDDADSADDLSSSLAPSADPNKENQNGGGSLSYRNQADRIASMLAETQSLLTTN